MTIASRPPVLPLEDVLALAASDYERDFLRFEFEPGLEYYVNRLDRLMLRGGALLDAGCGAGQWSLAGAQRFDRVEAIDLNGPRLDVMCALARRIGATNLHATRGSIEALPYASGSFDAVICYGVIMFTNVAFTLAELQRVLKPNGRLYVCLNADGWSRYLIAERGPSDARALAAGRETLYNTYWRRALAAGLEEQLVRTVRSLRSMLPAWMARWQFGPNHRVTLSQRQQRNVIDIGRRALLSSAAGEALLQQVERDCGREAVETVCADAWMVGTELGTPTRRIPSEAYAPEEFARLVTSAGFTDFQWRTENGLVCDWLTPSTAAKYLPMFESALTVWEMLATKPDRRRIAPADPAHHLAAALTARDTRVYLESADPAVLSTGTWDAYPPVLIEQAQALGVQLGGWRYLRSLVERLVAGARTEDEVARRLIGFVQRAVFRDPISQPLMADGSMPDTLTILLGARGRCGHTSQVLVDLLKAAGLDARVRPLGSHVIAEVLVDGRWVIADADAFKNGVLPVNRAGLLLTLDEVQADPHWLDTFQPTGWWIRKDSRFARGLAGGRVTGYVDALDPEQRGFVSGYYVPDVRAFPPAIPAITRFTIAGGRATLSWTPSTPGVVTTYRVAIGTSSRGWSYDEPGNGDQILNAPAHDVLLTQVAGTTIEVDAPPDVPLYAAVTALCDRVTVEPRTFYWPSEEAVSER